jgi:hypothetical protein
MPPKLYPPRCRRPPSLLHLSPTASKLCTGARLPEADALCPSDANGRSCRSSMDGVVFRQRLLSAGSAAIDRCKRQELSCWLLVEAGGGGVVGKPLVCQDPTGVVWERHDVGAREGAGRLMQVRRHGSTVAGPWATAGASAGGGDRMAAARAAGRGRKCRRLGSFRRRENRDDVFVFL